MMNRKKVKLLLGAVALLSTEPVVSLPHITQEREESILTKTPLKIIRKRRAKTYPYHTVGQVVITFEEGIRRGTGILIGNEYVLTAAHNLYDRRSKNFAREVAFFPGKYKEGAPSPWCFFGSAIYTHPSYVLSKESYKNYDLALLKLRKSVQPKGLLFQKLKVYPYKELPGKDIWIRGYPTNCDCEGECGKPEHSRCIGRFCEATGQVANSSRRKIFYKNNTFFGHSGSGIVIRERSRYFCVGVHAYGDVIYKGEKYNTGVRICSKRHRDLNKWMKELDKFNGKNRASIVSLRSLEGLDDEAIAEEELDGESDAPALSLPNLEGLDEKQLKGSRKQLHALLQEIDDRLKKKTLSRTP